MSESTFDTLSANGVGESTDNTTDSLLDNCKPTASRHQGSPHNPPPLIRRPSADQPFTRLAEPITLACVLDRHRDTEGRVLGEHYCPVTSAMQRQLQIKLREMVFHPCALANGAVFILPQKLDIPGYPANSWNASLAAALSEPFGQWLKIWTDQIVERYQFEHVPAPMSGLPDYRDFKTDLEKALAPNIIDRPNHPVIERILGQNRPAPEAEEIY